MQDFSPDALSDVLLLPGIFTFFGFLAFLLVRSAELRKRKFGFGRWVSFLILLAGLFIGFRWFARPFGVTYPWQFVTGADDFARSVYENTMFGSRKMKLAHNLVFILPAILFVIAVVLTILDRKAFRKSIVAASPAA